MTLGINLTTENGQSLDVQPLQVSENGGEHSILVTTNPQHIHGLFRSVSEELEGTYILTEPNLKGSIVLTDILLSAEKQNGGSVTIQFSDGTNIIPIFSADTTDAAVRMTIPLAGGWKGWENSRVEIVVVGDVTNTTAVGYYKIKRGEAFEDWNSRR